MFFKFFVCTYKSRKRTGKVLKNAIEYENILFACNIAIRNRSNQRSDGCVTNSEFTSCSLRWLGLDKTCNFSKKPSGGISMKMICRECRWDSLLKLGLYKSSYQIMYAFWLLLRVVQRFPSILPWNNALDIFLLSSLHRLYWTRVCFSVPAV